MTKIPTSSVSQVNNFRGCERKWFFSSVNYLPQEPRRATAIGDCFHEVAERYLDVDDSGMKDGRPPELYPEGWNEQKDYFKTKVLFVLDLKEQGVIKQLINKAIDEGVLIRRPKAITEYSEKVLITPEISFQVRIDYAYDWTIEDHKTCSNFRFTTVSDNDHVRYIGKDTQLKIYAYFWAIKRVRDEGVELPELLTIRHNQFCVGAECPRIETPSTQVTFLECKRTYEELKEDVLKQLEIRKGASSGEIKWTDMEKNLNSCGAYGGCQYKTVCTHQESPDMYKTRLNRKIKELTINNKEKEKSMGFNIAAAGATTAQAEVLKEIVEETKVPVVVPEVTEVVPEVVASEDTRTDDEKSRDLILEEQKVIEINCAGMGVPHLSVPKYLELQDSLNKVEAKIKKAKEAAEKKAKAEEEKAAKAASKEEAKVVEKTEEEEKVANTDGTPDFSVKAPIKSRSKNITVYLNCIPISGPVSPTLTIQELFQKKAAEMAHDQGVASYYDLDVFPRREAFARNISGIMEELSGFNIVAYGASPDEQALLNSIIANAYQVVASR
jgi:hypothetical protein